ncbi:monooxygenase [Pseudoalteromonas sp. A25]|nr:monooxygenase [Pseudoalteromonas sp. A25]
MRKSCSIAIVGAGVAGMALAILAKQQGMAVTLFERHSQISVMGAGVTLWPNAMWVLDKMGLSSMALRLGGQPLQLKQYDSQGQLLGELDLSAIADNSGYPCVTILRRDLAYLIAQRLEKLGIYPQFNRSVSVVELKELQQEYDLVVGADGRMASCTRALLFPNSRPLRYHHFINIIGISDCLGGTMGHAIADYRAPHMRFGVVPAKPGLCYWAAGWQTPMDRTRNESSWLDDMQQRFAHWAKPVQHVLSHYHPQSLKRIFVHDVEPLPYWHQDNLVIIGDAAHGPLPTSGQGACQALEDAWHLARLLSGPGILEHKLRAFYQLRIHKTTTIQTIGRQIAEQIFHSEKFALSLSSASPSQLKDFWMQGLEV